MAEIRPFRGIRFNLSRLQHTEEVITPPYDVIDSDGQDRLHQRNPYNIVRLEYGKKYPSDNDTENSYTRAENTLKDWLAQEILIADEQPAYYLYEQKFTYNSERHTRRGIFAALKTEDYARRTVLPHELTMSAPKADRLKLLGHLKTNISPIFTLYPDPDNMIDALCRQSPPGRLLFETGEDDGQVQLLRAITDLQLQEEITSYLAGQPLLIADGHHRYETALAYSKDAGPDINPGSNFILAALVSMKDPGLLVLPTHRVVAPLTAGQKAEMKKNIDSEFKYIEYGPAEELDEEDYRRELSSLAAVQPCLGMITAEKAGFLIPGPSKDDSPLPVVLLHEKILRPVLAPGENNEADKELLSYPHDMKTVIQSILSGNSEAAFVLDTLPVEDVLKRAQQGRVMPQKSTFFYPKLPGGLVLHHHSISY